MGVSFNQFVSLCKAIAGDGSYKGKTKIIKEFIEREESREYSYLIIKLLLPGVNGRVYNINDKQLIKLVCKLLDTDYKKMVADVADNGDASIVIGRYFSTSGAMTSARNSSLTIGDVDTFLTKLSQTPRERDRLTELKRIFSKCTTDELIYVVRLIKRDLRINAGPRYVLDALHENAYKMLALSNDLEYVVKNVSDQETIKLMVPVQPMLASICKTFEDAKTKFSRGIVVEFKYDGERIQIHKQGDKLSFYSRTLKPVSAHKVANLDKLLAEAFPGITSMILDGEIVMVDGHSGNILPFGTLGVNKRKNFSNALVCLFIFDCLCFNDTSLLNIPLVERRRVLNENIIEIPNRILLSDVRQVSNNDELVSLLNEVLSKGIEGFVLKDIMGYYEPGKRKWLKIKKDYLAGGKMSDKADLVVLGAYRGKGNKSGILSSFLMGCYDEASDRWCTVTKCSGGHTDDELKEIQRSLNVVPFDKESIPEWLHIHKAHYPDFVIVDIKQSPVWEITGSEFTVSPNHTASGISIRFPRCTRVRSDKNYKTATTLLELLWLVEVSRGSSVKGASVAEQNNE